MFPATTTTSPPPSFGTPIVLGKNRLIQGLPAPPAPPRDVGGTTSTVPSGLVWNLSSFRKRLLIS